MSKISVDDVCRNIDLVLIKLRSATLDVVKFDEFVRSMESKGMLPYGSSRVVELVSSRVMSYLRELDTLINGVKHALCSAGGGENKSGGSGSEHGEEKR